MVSGGCTCGLVRVQIFALGMRIVRSKATVILKREGGSLLYLRQDVGTTVSVRVCGKTGNKSVVIHCTFLLFPQMPSPASGSCTARSSGGSRFLVAGRSKKTGQHSRTVHPGK